MGVAAAYPGIPAVPFDGDGSLLMHVRDLETMKREGMSVLGVVLNDGGYGSEFHKLRAEELTTGDAEFGRTDLAAIARSFWIGGETVRDLRALPTMLDRFAAVDGRLAGTCRFRTPLSRRWSGGRMAAERAPVGRAASGRSAGAVSKPRSKAVRAGLHDVARRRPRCR